MMQLFIRFVRTCYEVPDATLRFSVNCYLGNGLTLQEIEHRWLTALDLPRTCLLAAAVNRPSRSSLNKRRTLPYGTGRLVVHSVDVARASTGPSRSTVGSMSRRGCGELASGGQPPWRNG